MSRSADCYVQISVGYPTDYLSDADGLGESAGGCKPRDCHPNPTLLS